MEWIISLASLGVSAVTVILSYITTLKTQKHNEKLQKSARERESYNTIFKNTFSLFDEFVLATDDELLRNFMDKVVILKNNNQQDDKIVFEINDLKNNIHSLQFKIRVNRRLLKNAEAADFEARLESYIFDIENIFELIQAFYINRSVTEQDFNEIHGQIKTFGEQRKNFIIFIQNEIISCSDRIF